MQMAACIGCYWKGEVYLQESVLWQILAHVFGIPRKSQLDISCNQIREACTFCTACPGFDHASIMILRFHLKVPIVVDLNQFVVQENFQLISNVQLHRKCSFAPICAPLNMFYNSCMHVQCMILLYKQHTNVRCS